MGSVGSLTPGWTGSTRLPPRTSQGRAPLTRELSPDVITLTVSPERHRYRDRVIGGGQPGTRGGGEGVTRPGPLLVVWCRGIIPEVFIDGV